MTQIKHKSSNFIRQNINATRIVASSFGVLCGLTGMIAGYFEMLQGNVKPSGLMISTIGPAYSMSIKFYSCPCWYHACANTFNDRWWICI
jgi:hypothetical protein